MNAQNELDFTGSQLRDKGIAKVLSHNEEWREKFFTAARNILQHSDTITAEDVVDVIGMPSGHCNAVGGAMRAFAIRDGLVNKGYVKSRKPSRHSAVVGAWGRTA